MYYILFYKTVENYFERRAPFRGEHLDLVQSFHADGRLVMAGALADPPDAAILIFKGDSPRCRQRICQQRPIYKERPHN